MHSLCCGNSDACALKQRAGARSQNVAIRPVAEMKQAVIRWRAERGDIAADNSSYLGKQFFIWTASG
jgi:hypothetical protein